MSNTNCDFNSLFGDKIYQLEMIPGCPLSENYAKILLIEKIYSFVFLACFILFVLAKHRKKYFTKLINDSIFVLLDDYYRIVYVKGDSLALEPFDEQCLLNHYSIFDFFHLFECCNMLFCNIFSPIYSKIVMWLYPAKCCFWRNSKYILFYIVVFGYVVLTPLEYLTSFLTAPCLYETSNVFTNPFLFFYGIMDLIFSSLSIFVLTFMISFISSRRELQSLHHNDIKGKAFFMHYHVKKGMIFAFSALFVKILLILISGHTYFDESLDAESNIYWLGRSFFFLFLIRRSHSRKRIQINCNYDYLKEESKFFQIQNFLYKHRISANKFLDFTNMHETFVDSLKEKLEKDVSVKMKFFKKIINTIEAQKFKNVIVKKNMDSGYHTFLARLLGFYFVLMVFLSVLMTLTIITPEIKQLKNSCFLNSAIVGFPIIDLIELCCFPYFFYKTTRKENLI